MGKGFEEGYKMSIGADFAAKKTNVDGRDYMCQIWDLAGQQRFSTVRAMYYRGSSGCLLVYDITNPYTFTRIPDWIKELVASNKETMVPALLIGNKADLRGESDHEVTTKQGQEYAQMLTDWLGIQVPFVETSAKTGSNIEEAFSTLIRGIVKFRKL